MSHQLTRGSIGVSKDAAPTIYESISPVFALLLSVSILLMGNGLLSTLLPVRGSLEDFPALQIGILGTSYYIGFTLGCFFGPALIERGGHIRTYLAMVSLASGVALAYVLVIDPLTWWTLRIVTGFCFSVLFIIIESWLNERATNKTRGTVFSIYTAINLTVITIGQLMLGLADPNTFALFAVTSILVSLSALPVAFTQSVSPANIPKVRPRLAKLYKNSTVGTLGCFAAGLALGSFWALGPIFAQDQGFDTFGIGLFMSAVVIGGAISQWPFGILSDQMDRRYVIVAATLLAMCSALSIIIFAVGTHELLLILGLCFGAGAFPIYSLSVAHANDRADDFVEASSGLLFVYGIGASIGPILTGLLRQNLAGPALFYFTVVVHTLLLVVIVWRIAQRNSPDLDHRMEFNESLIAAKTVAPIDSSQH